MADLHANLAYSTVATAPSPATSGTSLVVTAGHGTRFPTPGNGYNAIVWPAGVLPTPANAEIVRVTGKSTDTLTITRAQESTVARTIVVGDQIAVAITKKTLTDAEKGMVQIRCFCEPAGITINVNSTAYISIVPTEHGVDLAVIPWTHYRIRVSGNSNAVGQTVTAQLATSFATPTTAVHTGGNDLVMTNTPSLWDSGWLTRDDGASGVQNYILAFKGSNGTVDFAGTYIDVWYKYEPS